MPKTKISEFSATPGNNTDIDGINIAEGCAPSGINDAIRELMSQLKDFQAGTAGDSFNGPVGTTTAAAGAFTNLSASGTFALTGDQVQISEGGTGQTTANAAFNALAPSQTSNAGKYLKTDGTNTSWDALDISTADITGTLPVANGGTGVTSSTGTGSVVLSASPTFTGTVNGASLTLSSNFTLSGGTANGVAYLNGSKVLTTGSALSFDGTNLGIGTSSPGARIDASVSGGATYAIRATSSDSSTNARITARPFSGTTGIFDFRKQSDDTVLSYLGVTNGATPDLNIMNVQGFAITFGTNNTERARIDASGNMGLGTTTPTNSSGYSTLSLNGSTGGQLVFQTGGTYKQAIYSSSTDLNFYNQAAGNLTFSTNATERARITSGGNLLVGTTTNNASGGVIQVSNGITFPATQSASSDANTLDDYEEGNWTPGISFGNATTGITYTTAFNEASYTKIGNTVIVRGTLVLSSKGTATGAARLTNLPFVSSNNYRNGGAAICPNVITFTGQVWMGIEPNATTMLIRQTTEAGVRSDLTDANFANNSDFAFVISYQI